MCYQISFFKKVYFLITRDYDSRLYNTYDYCGHESVGYLIHLKKKFNINYKIPIVNYGNSPNSSWYFYDLRIKETNRVIFLNYAMGNKNFNYELNDEYSHNLNDYNISSIISLIIDNSYYKKDKFIKNLLINFIELFFLKEYKLSNKKNLFLNLYHKFMLKIENTKKFNLDDESLFLEFKSKLL